MNTLNRQNLYLQVNVRELDSVSPTLVTPEEIGSYSLDINKKYVNSRASLKYFVKPPDTKNVNFDLRKGFETRIIKPHGTELHVLHWITENMDKFSSPPDQNNERPCERGASGQASSTEKPEHSVGDAKDKDKTDEDLDDVQASLSKLQIDKGEKQKGKLSSQKPRNLNIDFVCRRGVLADIMLTPYEEKEGWLLAVTLYNGTYYLQEIVSEDEKRREENIKDDEMSCWGWKFEQYVTADRKDGKPNTDVPYNNCEKFYAVVKTKLNKHSLVLSGVAEAVNADGDYVELKTNKIFQHEGHEKTFKRYKTKKWWAQSHLTGVKQIVCGFRNEKGVVKQLGIFNTDELPRISSDIFNAWKANVCTNFLDKFLTFVKSSITTDDYKIVHTLEWIPRRRRIECSPPLTDSEYNFLPDWYIDREA